MQKDCTHTWANKEALDKLQAPTQNAHTLQFNKSCVLVRTVTESFRRIRFLKQFVSFLTFVDVRVKAKRSFCVTLRPCYRCARAAWVVHFKTGILSVILVWDWHTDVLPYILIWHFIGHSCLAFFSGIPWHSYLAFLSSIPSSDVLSGILSGISWAFSPTVEVRGNTWCGFSVEVRQHWAWMVGRSGREHLRFLRILAVDTLNIKFSFDSLFFHFKFLQLKNRIQKKKVNTISKTSHSQSLVSKAWEVSVLFVQKHEDHYRSKSSNQEATWHRNTFLFWIPQAGPYSSQSIFCDVLKVVRFACAWDDSFTWTWQEGKQETWKERRNRRHRMNPNTSQTVQSLLRISVLLV